ncbi:MAG: DUF1987 domain-containing protein [Bacteroidota bacterium]|nr:MAG: DUF1987 domain-containing protein [Bacteroidota bacterium]
MDILKIERTPSSPGVVFDADELLISIRGISNPANAANFFRPLVNWLEEFHSLLQHRTSAPLNIEINLKSINSESMVMLTDLFKIISKIHRAGMKIIVEWYYSEDNEAIREAGQEISDATELPFIFLEE